MRLGTVILALLCAGCANDKKSEIRIPKESCHRTETGNKNIRLQPMMVGKNTILMPSTYREYRYVCTFTKME